MERFAMAANLATHPSADTLRAFGLGKLDDAKSQSVLRHLESCPDCCKVVSALSGDSFLERLKGAHSHGGPSPCTKSLPGGAKSSSAGSTPAIPNLPPELANHQQYQVLRELGRGGMGVVYLAKNVLMDRLEVLKVVSKELLDKPGASERFLREIRAAAKLSHDNVVMAYSALALSESVVFAMEYVEGKDLAKLVKEQGPMPVVHACFYVHQAALGLQHACEHKMVHRDIKPHNLMLSRQGKKHLVKILDFGLAKATREGVVETELTGAGKMLGTPDYIAPEQTLDAASADIRADIYSLGCTLYFLLSGSPPFKAKSLFEILQAHMSMEAVPLDQVRPEVPAELAAVVAKMMAKDPAQRYQQPIEVARALAPFVKAVANTPVAEAAGGKSMPQTSSVVKSVGKSMSPDRESSVKPAPVRTETIVEGSATTAEGRKSAAAQAAPRIGPKRWPLVVGAGVALMLLGLVLVGVGAFIVIRLKTADGSILEIEVNEPNPDVFVDGEKVTVTWDNGGKKAEIRVQPGRKVEVKKDGFTVTGGEVEIKDGQRHVLTAKLSQIAPPVSKGSQISPPGKEAEKEKTSTEKGEKKTSSEKGEEKPSPLSVQGDGFVPLFNGKDLSGWTTHPNWKDGWRVENGLIVWRRQDRGVLWTARDDYTDFHLRVETRIDTGYAQVIVRGQSKEISAANHQGYTIVINNNNGNPSKTGSLGLGKGRGVVNVSKAPVPPNQWFLLEVIVKGDHVIVKVDGRTTAERTDPGGPFLKGNIMLLSTTNDQWVEFRKIEIKELPPTKPAAEKPPAPEDPLIAGMKFVRVPKGTFWMSRDGKNAQVQVTIGADFELAAYTVTQEQWQTVMGTNPSEFSRQGGYKDKVKDITDADLNHFPVEKVSWDDGQEFIKKLNAQQKGRGWAYRLPSEAEWEYACRGAATSKEECSYDFYLDKPTNDLSSKQANFDGNQPAGRAEEGPHLGRPTKVGSYPPNKLGLYDMHGNVKQWCADLYNGGPGRVVRGGFWYCPGQRCHAANRGGGRAPFEQHDFIGLRVARVPSSAK
jgi:serine/threonine protein kinase/formylglycine-generating enzyme required for sulfatase activity